MHINGAKMADPKGEGVNDAHRLSVDPTMRRITGKKIDHKNAASANTMGRFETKMLSVEDNLNALSAVNGRWVERALQKTTHRRIILDMDSSASPVHGEQEASAYNGHFGCTCYHPLFCFNQFGDCEGSMLRPGNVHSADRWKELLEPIVARYERKTVRQYFRGDAAFAKPEIYEYLVDLEAVGLRSYVSEPRRGKRRWRGDRQAQQAVYANRRRIRGERGQRLLRQRGERLQRPGAHLYGSGGMRRLHVRGHENVLKRLLIQVSAFNLGMLMRQSLGVGTPRGLQGRICALMLLIFSLSKRFQGLFRPIPAARPKKSAATSPSLLPPVRTA